MPLGQNPFNPSRTLPALAAIQRRHRELLAYQDRHESAQALATPAEGNTNAPQGFELTKDQEEQQESDELQETCAEKESEPSVVLPPRSSAPPPPSLDGEAFHGIAGLLVRTLAPHTEADPAAVLLQFLAAFGNLVGPAPHCRVGTTLWSSRCVATARSTPSTILHVLGRDTGQLSPLLRRAWDGGDLCAHDGHRYVQATAAHISIVGHITQGELAHHLSHAESHNGFANRCLWTSVRRSQSLPNGGSLPPEQQSVIAGSRRKRVVERPL